MKRFLSYTFALLALAVVLGVVLGAFTAVRKALDLKSTYKSPEMVADALRAHRVRHGHLPSSLPQVFGGHHPVFDGREFVYTTMVVGGKEFGFAVLLPDSKQALDAVDLRAAAASGQNVWRKGDTVIVAVPAAGPGKPQ